MDFGKIYKITNIITKKVYIGKTVQDLKDRTDHHFNEWSNCKKLKEAVKMYGKENFTIEIIMSGIPYTRLDERETFFIKEYNSIEEGYNVKEGNKKCRNRTTHFIKDEIKESIIKDYNDGYKGYQIAERNNVCQTSVYNILKNIDKHYNKGGFNTTGKINFEEFAELKRQGYTTKQLCEYFDVGRSSVKRMVQRHRDIIFPRVSESCEQQD